MDQHTSTMKMIIVQTPHGNDSSTTSRIHMTFRLPSSWWARTSTNAVVRQITLHTPSPTVMLLAFVIVSLSLPGALHALPPSGAHAVFVCSVVQVHKSAPSIRIPWTYLSPLLIYQSSWLMVARSNKCPFLHKAGAVGPEESSSHHIGGAGTQHANSYRQVR